MIKSAFAKKPLFIPFIMAGHSTVEISIQAIMALSRMGCDIIEIGVPFSDPIADGPINQQAAEMALKNGVNLDTVLDLVSQVRSQGCSTPIVLFSYLNPILAMDPVVFAGKAKKAGVNGVLIVDLPAEEGEVIYSAFHQAGLEIILLASPTTDPARFDLYQQYDPAFIYYISRCGVTGTQHELSIKLEQEVQNLRAYLPPDQNIAVGFGISTAEQIKQVAGFADGVIVGSRLVQILQEEGLQGFEELALTLMRATRSN
jgi:tryptophan synthase alpha subunit